jgi:putative addiction module component (TIGR02574 family)
VEVLVWTICHDVCDAILVRSGGKCQTPVMAKLEIDINKLTPEERLDLIEELWDSLSADPAKIPLTDPQAKELDRRVAEMEQDKSLGIPWEAVLAQIRERK